jgi:hypothetical protein
MRHSKLVSCLIAAGVALAQLGCGDEPSPNPQPNTCTTGSNMTDPRLVAGLEPSAGGSLIRITWDPGTDFGASLSSDYFSAAQLSRETPSEVQPLVSNVSLMEERQLTVRFRNLGPYLATHRTLEFVLEFPDRRQFISCTHAGMDDVYLLRVRLEFDEHGQLQNTVMTEDVSLGDI